MEKNSDKGKGFSQKRVFEFNGKKMDFTRPRVMGIVNLTPDSFYRRVERWKGGKGIGQFSNEALRVGDWEGMVGHMLLAGAYMIDLGAVSTRPGAPEVSVEEEERRLLPVLKEIRKKFPDAILSIDTFRAEIARIAASEGADMINDISGGTFDEMMIPTVTGLGIPFIVMHIQGTPQNMQMNPQYENVTDDVFSFLLKQANLLESSGHHKFILDPGFGFGKTVEHNFEILRNLDRLVTRGYPVLAGMSRKSMINRVLGTRPDEALNGTTVLNTIALLKGASILRVHDVKEALEAVNLVEKLFIA